MKKWGRLIADNPAFIPATLDRVQRCVERDKNRPAVVIWSMGNECAYGCTFEEALKWQRRMTTPVCFIMKEPDMCLITGYTTEAAGSVQPYVS